MKNQYLWSVLACLGLGAGNSLAQDEKSAAAAFIQESRALLNDLAVLQLSEVPRFGTVAKCVPRPPNPDGTCPPLCPPSASLQAFRHYSQGRSRNVAAAVPMGSVAADPVICEPVGVQKKLNELVRRVDQLGRWVVTSDRRGVTIMSTVPRGTPPAGIPDLKPSTVRSRGLAALEYLNGEFSQGREPNVRMR